MILAVLGLGTHRLTAAYDLFFRFGPTDSSMPYLGESNDPQFNGSNGWTRLTGIQQSNNRPFSPEAGSRPITWQIGLTKAIDRGSPALFQNAFTATEYQFADAVFRRQGPVDPKAAIISVARLDEVSVRKLLHTGGPYALTESLVLDFKRLQWTHYTVDALNRVTSSTVHWDLSINEGGSGPVPGLTLNPTNLAAWPAGLAYSQTFTSFGGRSPYRYELVQGQLPPGLTLSSAGVLSGVPTALGSFTFAVRSTDDSFAFIERSYTLPITSACGAPPRFSSVSVAGATVRLRLEAFPACRYQLQQSPSLSGPWSNLGPASTAPNSGILDWTDSGSPGQRYYRAVAVP